jgi:hypothetical protein
LYAFLISPIRTICLAQFMLDLIILIIFDEYRLLSSSLYSVFSLYSLHPSLIQTFFSATWSQTPLYRVISLTWTYRRI